MMLNDHIAGVCRDFPNRFAGLGTIPMQLPRLAIQEMERCVKQLGLRGVEIGTHVNGINLDDPTMFPVFEAAAELGAAVFVHPWDMFGQERMKKYWMPWLVGMPAETALAICSVIFGGVLERLPKLRICFAHGGGAFPYTIGRIEHGFMARPDLCAADNDVNPRDYLGKFYVDSLVHDADAMRLLIKLIGAERIALGSDYPFPLGEQIPGTLLMSMSDLSAQCKQRILAGTALEFLNVPASKFMPSASATSKSTATLPTITSA
jgi:aminocarboxymuconate-semialdehyde decarboxylase